MLIDRPAPSVSYVLLYLGLIVFLVALPLFLKRYRKLRGVLTVVVFAVCFLAAAVFAVFLSAGFTTRYSLDNNTLSLRSGFLSATQVKLEAIRSVDKVPLNWQALGWALNKTGFCVRFDNCLRLTTQQRVVYLSPRDPDQFMLEILSRQKKSNLLRKNLIFR
jgi:hypothetical protein